MANVERELTRVETRVESNRGKSVTVVEREDVANRGEARVEGQGGDGGRSGDDGGSGRTWRGSRRISRSGDGGGDSCFVYCWGSGRSDGGDVRG